MSRERFIERQNQVREAAARLAEAATQPETDIARDATIKRFEFTFKVVWKTLRLFLEHHGHKCNIPSSTIKKAFVAGLIATLEEADVWLRMLEDRNLTSHTYNEALARRIHNAIVGEYAVRLSAMATTTQSLVWG
ncbi:MAG: nucleotidyltransferase substrate binding protein [Roseiflexus sp.]|jgi:nucleotidyltransferase substrate binding protein (TIGR01987 family)|nr:nucleotidyltransferase substrate binding protein [Roseiflexus sp.]MBO9333369.1 nucleotidyltransferase substrate binding protein [Roseiflexus sp.]MBO9342824.1 nucleotidyltransferase substrate binding protein [Roseiflexus sp.]MBO9366038.1 nucleotidyltransferase substrate binding protein [Roseiflexus sp.]MBO9383230.1 nucleotidyltransferase substrate binding protein [Roseiflexus sp.]